MKASSQNVTPDQGAAAPAGETVVATATGPSRPAPAADAVARDTTPPDGPPPAPARTGDGTPPAPETGGEVPTDGAAKAADSSPRLPYHELADVFPLLEGQAFETFRDGIKQHDLREDIITYEGKILDGRNRYRAYLELGIEPTLRAWDGPGSPADFVWSKNAQRRHLTESQRAMAATVLVDWKKEDAQRRMRAGKAPDPVANLPQGRSRDLAAEQAKVSPRSVQDAQTVLRKGTPELVQAVRDGKVPVSTAAVVAELSPAKQRDAVAQGKKGVADAAKEVRPRKAKKKAGKGKAQGSNGAVFQITVAESASHIAGQLFEHLGAERAAEVRDALTELISERGGGADGDAVPA
jgi:hypothetical protein